MAETIGAVLIGAFFVFLFWLFVIEPFTGRKKNLEKPEPYDLTQLAKEDYDFLVTNGMQRDPKADRHFYPPNVYHRIGDGQFVNKLALEQQKGIAQQKMLLATANRKNEEEYDKRRPALIAQENAIREKYSGNRIVAGPVEIRSDGLWIDTEKIRG